jgi:WD40 repeat protein
MRGIKDYGHVSANQMRGTDYVAVITSLSKDLEELRNKAHDLETEKNGLTRSVMDLTSQLQVYQSHFWSVSVCVLFCFHGIIVAKLHCHIVQELQHLTKISKVSSKAVHMDSILGNNDRDSIAESAEGGSGDTESMTFGRKFRFLKNIGSSEGGRATTGPIYCSAWAGQDCVIATGGFDRWVRVHRENIDFGPQDRNRVNNEEDINSSTHVIGQHQQPVSDVSWVHSTGSRRAEILLSSSYDGSIGNWDIISGGQISRVETGRMLQCVKTDLDNPHLCYCAGVAKQIHVIDLRVGSTVNANSTTRGMVSGSAISSLDIHTTAGGTVYITSGENDGSVKFWDLRIMRSVESLTLNATDNGNGQQRRSAVSHICSCKVPYKDGSFNLMGVNSYDDTLKIYDR